MEFVEVGQGDCLQRGPECAVCNGVLRGGSQVDVRRGQMVVEGPSGQESGRMGRRKVEGGGMSVGMNNIGVAVIKDPGLRSGIPMSGNARLSIRNHAVLIGPITDERTALRYYYSPISPAREDQVSGRRLDPPLAWPLQIPTPGTLLSMLLLCRKGAVGIGLLNSSVASVPAFIPQRRKKPQVFPASPASLLIPSIQRPK